MSRIKINRIKPPTVSLYNPDGEYMGEVNIFEFGDIRIQICEHKARGYYVKNKGEDVEINDDGSADWEGLSGFADVELKQVQKLYKARKENEFKPFNHGRKFNIDNDDE